MKRKAILLILLSFSLFTFAQETDVLESESTEEKNFDWKETPFIKFFTEPWYTISFNEGLSYAQVTRIEKMEDHSNFVRESFMAGAFVNMKTDNLLFLDFVIQLGAYYPYYYAFNGMRQYPKNQILYAIDTYFGTVYSFDFLKYVLIDVSLGMHYMYQLTDEYHMSYLGLGTLNTIELPLTKRWSIINNYFFSYDDANLGSNKNVQKFDASYQYHIDLGVRYTSKAPNSYYYIDIEKIKEKMQSKKGGDVNYK